MFYIKRESDWWGGMKSIPKLVGKDAGQDKFSHISDHVSSVNAFVPRQK